MEAKAGREWFYRLGEEEFGPITWTELRRLVHSGKISRQHEVRICRDSHAGQWRPISTISHLLPELNDEILSTESEVRVEQQIITEMKRSEESPPKPTRSTPQVPKPTSWKAPSSPGKSWSWDPLIDTLNGARFALLETLENLVRLIRKQAVPLAFLILLISLNAIYWAWASMETEQMQIDKVAQIGRRYSELRKERFDPATWSEFIQKSKATLQEMIPSLERHASVDRSIQQHLLWASKDCLMVMLDRPWGEGDELQKEFSKHMSEIEDKLRRARGE